MKIKKPLFVSLTYLLLININALAQFQIIFENVIHTTPLVKPTTDFNYTYNFEYLSAKQVTELGNNMLRLKSGGTDNLGDSASFHLFYSNDEFSPMEPWRVRSKLTIVHDSMDQEQYDANGNNFMVRIPGMIDSSWYFQNLRGIEFSENWLIDTTKFSCEIKTKMYMPLVFLRGKEDLGPQGLFYIKAGTQPKNYTPIADFIITDVYVKQDPINLQNYDQITINEANAELDFYKLIMLMNSTIDKVKSGKLKCYQPSIPFKKPFTLAEVKSMFTSDFATTKNDGFPVKYKMYSYRFKLVQKWWIDPISLAFKKEAIGMILMKRNEENDLSKNQGGELFYTFSSLAYIPFNNK